MRIKDDTEFTPMGPYVSCKDKPGKVDFGISETNILYSIYIKNTSLSKSGNKPVNYIFSTSLSLIQNNRYRRF